MLWITSPQLVLGRSRAFNCPYSLLLWGTKLFLNEVAFSHHTVNEIVIAFRNNALFDVISVSITVGLPSIDNNGISPRIVVS